MLPGTDRKRPLLQHSRRRVARPCRTDSDRQAPCLFSDYERPLPRRRLSSPPLFRIGSRLRCEALRQIRLRQHQFASQQLPLLVHHHEPRIACHRFRHEYARFVAASSSHESILLHATPSSANPISFTVCRRLWRQLSAHASQYSKVTLANPGARSRKAATRDSYIEPSP